MINCFVFDDKLYRYHFEFCGFQEECNVKRRTKDDRSRRKDDKKSSEPHMKILSHVSSTEEKLEVMCKKYSQVTDENRRLSLALKHSEKKVEVLLREREQFHAERNKSIMTRKRLENLCRELQKQNKVVKNESLQRVKEQEEIRKDLSEKFQGGLAQITTLMNQNIEKNAKMYEENLEINKKFKTVYEQVEQKEQQLLKVHQQMKLDLQVADAKLAKVKMEATAEKEALLKEKQQLLFKISEYQAQIKELQTTEVGLRSEISMYTDKYDEFQSALHKSNKIYGEFNVEMEKMTKKMHVLEKETSVWKQRWAKSHDALVTMATDKQARDGEIATLSKKVSLLQDLCKMFQSERTKLLVQLKIQGNRTQTPLPESPIASTDPQDVEKQTNELPNLDNTIEQLQVSLTSVSEDMRKDLDMNLQTANDIAVTNQELEAAKVELYEENTERSQTVAEDAAGDSNEDCNSSESKAETSKLFHLNSIVLDNVTETNIENEELTDAITDTHEESFKSVESLNSEENAMTITEITHDESFRSIESLNPEETDKDQVAELLIKEKNEEINKATEFLEDTSDTSGIVVEKQIQPQINAEETEDEAEVKKRNEVSELNSILQPELKLDISNNELLQVVDLLEKEAESLQKNEQSTNEEVECQTIEKVDNSSRNYENATNEIVEENKSAEDAHTNSNEVRTSLNNLTLDSSAVTVEGNIETVVETKADINNCEPSTESISALVENIPEVSKTTDTSATKDIMLIINDESKVATETANKVINNSELVDTIDIQLTKDPPSIDEGTAGAELATCSSATKDTIVPSKIPADTSSTSKSDRVEEKLRRPIKVTIATLLELLR